MKPKIDLADPSVAALIQLFNTRAKGARDLASKLDDAIRPIFAVKVGSKLPTQIGSCVLLTIQDQVFALSASHVFDSIGAYAVLVGCGTKLHPLTGDRFSTARGPSGSHQDDPVDASVLHITCEMPSEIRASALTLRHIDWQDPITTREFFVAAGYRASRSRSTSGGLASQLDRYPTVEHEESEYIAAGLNRARHISLASDDQVLIENKWQTAPGLKGMSGGAILRVEGLPIDPMMRPGAAPQAKLVAITIERKAGRSGKQPAMIGTRIGIHLGLIRQYLPHLFATT